VAGWRAWGWVVSARGGSDGFPRVRDGVAATDAEPRFGGCPPGDYDRVLVEHVPVRLEPVRDASDRPCARETVVTLSRAQLEELAGLMVEKLETRRREAETLVGATAVAAWTGLSVPSVYRCAERLGGFRVGEGPRAPWRWRITEVAERYDPAGWGWLR